MTSGNFFFRCEDKDVDSKVPDWQRYDRLHQLHDWPRLFDATEFIQDDRKETQPVKINNLFSCWDEVISGRGKANCINYKTDLSDSMRQSLYRMIKKETHPVNVNNLFSCWDKVMSISCNGQDQEQHFPLMDEIINSISFNGHGRTYPLRDAGNRDSRYAPPEGKGRTSSAVVTVTTTLADDGLLVVAADVMPGDAVVVEVVEHCQAVFPALLTVVRLGTSVTEKGRKRGGRW